MSAANGSVNGLNGAGAHPGTKLVEAYKEDAETKSQDA